MGELTQRSVEFAHAIFGRAASEQGGVLSGDNPTHYNAQNPIRLWIIQVVIIISMSQFLALFLGRIRQPRVIAEVIGGVILGPTVMGRIPHFRQRIFPEEGMAMLSLTSTIGLILFLFLVGLEIDTKIMKRNIRASSAVSIAGLVIPLGLGAALGVGVYREFISDTVNFGYFLLFIAVAVGITAFPVLCRILTELKLLDTSVGVVVLSAGVGNDVIGWILLALTVALVNASSGLTALWVLLCCAGFVVLLLYPGKWGYVWLARRTGSLEQGAPTPFMMTITIFVVFGSAFFTDIIGVHAIFGGFLAGLIIPHENGYAISLVEKLEDLVSILFLPLYFTLSGLRTNLGLLDDGRTWGYVILICVVAFSAKFFACGAAAKAFGFNWRESAAIGSLMSCKGLVELIVLNIGLQANILDPRTFSMFVVHALVLTFITTPLVLVFYPERVRVHEHSGIKAGVPDSGESGTGRRGSIDQQEHKTRFTLVLERFEQLPIAMTLSQLLQGPTTSAASTVQLSSKALEAGVESAEDSHSQSAVSIDTLRLIELTNRTSAVLKSQEAETLLWNDPIIGVFRTFGRLNRLSVTAALSVVNNEQFPSAISDHAIETNSQMVILPWCNTNVGIHAEAANSSTTSLRWTNFDQTNSVVYSEFVRKVFLTSPTDVAVFVDRGIHPSSYINTAEQHLFLPFFGGPDDRLALSLIVQLCANPSVKATVIRIQTIADDGLTPTTTNQDPKLALAHNTVAADTVYGVQNTQTRLQSDTADNIIWERFTGSSSQHSRHIASALSRITFDVRGTGKPLHTIIDRTNEIIDASRSHSRNVIAVLGRSRRMAVESHQAELVQLLTERNQSIGTALPRALGDVGAAFVGTGVSADLLVVQAAV
ncbi:K(+)/H(+) antiporter [Pleurotus ostreatus]|uniref:K(+)/H(+) antiporter n=1 Tax=Pleurotus ostreatus TaxID=5322 RepID=A0A8H7DWD6_PLEOS|nr:K(+)/H(+) antiporter [Pleurotus ostreatus]KAF7432803.1 K(+)/H(+) antiporter [Pleurotus ostreatus]KAJ8698642.1 K(+)/H(+) antiporter [Pleurotus ostreatus]